MTCGMPLIERLHLRRHNNFRVAKAFSPNIVKAHSVHFSDYYYRLEAKMKARYLRKLAFQQLLLTLMRLRLALQLQDLGYRFGIHPSTMSRIFASVLEVMYVQLKFLIKWPQREILRQSLPMDFRKYYPKCVVIIDCFEVFIDRLTDLLARAQTYSSYKHHNTAKYLIGITPQGSVSFISEGWGGRVSDKQR